MHSNGSSRREPKPKKIDWGNRKSKVRDRTFSGKKVRNMMSSPEMLKCYRNGSPKFKELLAAHKHSRPDDEHLALLKVLNDNGYKENKGNGRRKKKR